MKAIIIGAGLAGLSTAVELADRGYSIDIYESRPFVGGKVGSWVDEGGNHIEMGLHVFFFNYTQLFDLMKKVGAFQYLLPKQHTHTFINRGGKIGELDFRFPIGAPFNGLKAFFTTEQLGWLDKLRNALALGTSPLVRGIIDYEGAMKIIRSLDRVSFAQWFRSHGGSEGSLKRLWNPIAYALGFIDTEAISARCMLTIFQMFAAKTEASKLNMLAGSPHSFLHEPILKYLTQRNTNIHTKCSVRQIHFDDQQVTGITIGRGDHEEEVNGDVYIAACDVPGIKRLIPPAWRKWKEFDNIYNLETVPVVTVQLRFDGWVTELDDSKGRGLDNLLYTADADFSCFADLALTSPKDYYREGEGSLIQAVLTPGDPYLPMANGEIAQKVLQQVCELFPSARDLNMTWFNVVKLAQSLYREAPGMDVYRPDQKTPIKNFFLAGSYTMQDYIDSMEGATLSGKRCAQAILQALA